jgi:hypothetical protein
VAKVLNHTPEQPLSEAELVDVAIAFANGTDFVMSGVRPTPYPEGAVANLQKVIAGHLESMICEDQELSVDDQKRAAARRRAALSKHLLEMQWGARWDSARCVVRAVPGGLQFRYFETLLTAYAVANRGVALLLDPTQEYGAKLCRCRLATCRQFFLEKRPDDGKRGRTLRRYCSSRHRDEGHEQLADARRQRVATKQRRKA